MRLTKMVHARLLQSYHPRHHLPQQDEDEQVSPERFASQRKNRPTSYPMIVGSAVALITIVSIGADTAYFLTTHHLFPFTHVIGSVKAHPNPQAVLQATLLHDDNALDQGVLSYPRSGALTTGDRKRLDVTVEDIGRHPHATLSVAEASRKSG